MIPQKPKQGFLFLGELKENDRIVSYKKRQTTGGSGGGWEECTVYGRSLKFLSSQMLGQKNLVRWDIVSLTHTHLSSLLQGETKNFQFRVVLLP